MGRQEEGHESGNGSREDPQETERGEHREKGPQELEPKPMHEKGELTEEAIEEGEKRTS